MPSKGKQRAPSRSRKLLDKFTLGVFSRSRENVDSISDFDAQSGAACPGTSQTNALLNVVDSSSDTRPSGPKNILPAVSGAPIVPTPTIEDGQAGVATAGNSHGNSTNVVPLQVPIIITTQGDSHDPPQSMGPFAQQEGSVGVTIPATSEITDAQRQNQPSPDDSQSNQKVTGPENFFGKDGGRLSAEIQTILAQLKTARDDPQKKKWFYKDHLDQRVVVVQRIARLLRSVENYAKIVDVAIQHSPETTALIWAGARFILVLALNAVEFMEALEVTLATVIEKMATCEYYSRVYDGVLGRVKLGSDATTQDLADRIDGALANVYSAVQEFINKARQHFEPGMVRATMNFFVPFTVSIKPLLEAIQEKERILEQIASMATMERTRYSLTKLGEIEDILNYIQKDMQSLNKLDEITSLVEKASKIGQKTLEGVQELGDEIRTFHAVVSQLITPRQRELLFYITSLDPELQRVKQRYIEQSEGNNKFESDLYVPTRGMVRRHAPDSEHSELYQLVKAFLEEIPPTPMVCLIQGSAGSGKSTFLHYLGRRLWDEYDKNQDSVQLPNQPLPSIPLFITLASVHDPSKQGEDLIEKFLKEQGWIEEWITAARRNLQFVFILDGYDEINITNRHRNFYTDNKLGAWKAKVIITSRPEYLTEGYKSQFCPSREVQMLQEFWIASFSKSDIDRYIENYLEKTVPANPNITPDYYKALVSQSEVGSLISNPFLLRMVLEVGPSLLEERLGFSRVTLYEQFFQHWIDKAEIRLNNIHLSDKFREALSFMCDEEGFCCKVQQFCQNFAIELYRHQALEATYYPPRLGPFFSQAANMAKKDPSIWEQYLGSNDETRLARFSSPLIRDKNSYRFLHKSLRDFLVAQALWQQLFALRTDGSLSLPETLINRFRIIDDSGVVDFVVENAELNSEFRECLLSCVEASKSNRMVEQAAANAITVLVRAGHQFTKCNLDGIRIQGADLRNGWFEKATMKDANLNEVQLQSAWLRETDMRGAQMVKVELGQRPYESVDIDDHDGIDGIHVCSMKYLASGELLLCCLVAREPFDDGIAVYSVTRMHLMHIHWGYQNANPRVAISADGTLLACSHEADDYNAVCLWNVGESTEKNNVRVDVGGYITYLSFSTTSQFVLVGGTNGLVHILGVETGEFVRSIDAGQQYKCPVDPSEYTSAVSKIELTLDSNILATIVGGHGEMNTLSIWSVISAECLYRFVFTKGCHSLAISPDDQFITWADGIHNSLTLWSQRDQKVVHTFQGHSQMVTDLLFSLDGSIIASISKDSTLRLWSIEERQLLNTIMVGDSWEGNVAFSPDGKYISTLDFRAGVIIRHWTMLSPREKSEYRKKSKDKNDSKYLRDLMSFMMSPQADDQDFTVFMSYSGDITLFSMTRRQILHTFPIKSATVITWSPSGDLFAVGHYDGNLSLWTVASLTQTNNPEREVNLQGHSDCVHSLAFSTDGSLIVSGSRDTTLRLWSVLDDHCNHVCAGHTQGVLSVGFSPDGSLVVSGSLDGTIRLWSVLDGQCIHVYEIGEEVEYVEFSPDGNKILFTHFVGDLHVLPLINMQGDPNQGFRMQKFKKRNNVIVHQSSKILHSKDGRVIMASFSDQKLRFWSSNSGRLISEVHTGLQLGELSWKFSPTSPDEGFLYGISKPTSIQCWKVRVTPKADELNPISVDVTCLWSEPGYALNVAGMLIENVVGLDGDTQKLLLQEGAISTTADNDGSYCKEETEDKSENVGEEGSEEEEKSEEKEGSKEEEESEDDEESERERENELEDASGNEKEVKGELKIS